MGYSIATLSGGSTTLDDATVDSLSKGLAGRLVTPGDSDYDEVRAIWNAMIDKRPGLIAQCANSADVVRCVNLARENRLLVSVRGAGHNIAGNSVTDGGFMIDLSKMKNVTVDANARTATVEPGVTLGELDTKTQEHGLATPTGINSTTGIAGLTLGGGFGWLSRKLGMTIDNLLSANVVTAEGELVTASADSNPDLFWGIRGGGGNLGVVTSFTFKLHPVGPEVFAGLIVHPGSDARACLEYYREFTKSCSDQLTVWSVLRKAPPLPFLPESVHGTDVVVFALLYSGKVEDGIKEVQPLRDFGSPVGEHLGPMPYAGFQTAFDPLLTPGARNYWKSHNFAKLDDGLIDTLLKYAGNLPTGQSEIFVAAVGGAQGRVAPNATAYWHRDTAFVMNVHTRWEDAADDDRCIAWAREFFKASAEYATGGVYVNFMPDDEGDRVAAAYGGNYDRMMSVKEEYDPSNLFRMNQNVQPAAG